MTQLQDETFEAINGGLFRLEYEFLGETKEGVEAWWHRGDRPRDIRLRVHKSSLVPFVEMTTTFRNVENKVGSIIQNVDCRGSRVMVAAAVEKAMLRQLQIFRDVIEQRGVAGPETNVAPVESTADSNVPDTEGDEADADL